MGYYSAEPPARPPSRGPPQAILRQSSGNPQVILSLSSRSPTARPVPLWMSSPSSPAGRQTPSGGWYCTTTPPWRQCQGGQGSENHPRLCVAQHEHKWFSPPVYTQGWSRSYGGPLNNQ